MKLRVLSDIHLEYNPISEPSNEADVTILCGDIFTKERQLPNDLCDFYKSKYVIGIAGNHEFYGHKIDTYTNELYEIYHKRNGIFLENDYITIDDKLSSISINDTTCNSGYRFIGTTLWTDFRLFGNDINTIKNNASILVGTRYTSHLREYYKIRVAKRNYRKFRPLDAAILNQRAVSFIESSLNLKFDGIVSVLTHHGPSIKTIQDKDKNDIFSLAYASNLDWLMEKYNPNYWFYGHIHKIVPNISISGTKLVSNPSGILSNFDSNFIMEI